MTDINPAPSWAAVRQLEVSEFALGGANGNMNEQAKSLAARSEFLKQRAAYQYNTMAEANADIANIAVNQNVNVVDSGLYYKATAGETTLTKSAYDPLTQAKAYADANGLFKPIKVAVDSLALAENFITQGWYVFTSTTPATNAGLPSPSAGFLLVVNYLSMIYQKWIPYNSNKEYVRTSNTSGVFPAWQEVITQNTLSQKLTAYLTETELDNILAGYVTPDNINQYNLKPYDIVTPSKNLYDASKKQVGKYVNNSGIIALFSGWTCSDFIPVVAGEWYTITFTTKRNGLSWFADKETSGSTNVGYNTSSSNPLTVQAPAGANFLVVNIDSTTVTGMNVQVEAGQVATTYEPFGDKYQIDASYLSESSTSVGYLSVNGASATLSGYIDNKKISLDLLLTRESTHNQSTVFNFLKDTIDNIVQRNPTDDVAPFRMDGTTIGANHGYQKSDLTLVDHGKTTADIGSVWSSGGKEYVIVDIVSTSVLSITSRSDNVAFVLGQLVHVSGATNNASFTPTSTTSSQWYPVFKNRKLTAFVDDKLIDLTVFKTYRFNNEVSFHESYEIMRKIDIVEWLIANKGQNYVNYDAIPCSMANFSYVFDRECGCTIYASLTAYKDVPFTDMMATQSLKLDSTTSYYVPKTVPFTQDAVNYDFTQLTPMTSNPTNSIYFTAARNEVGVNPVDRLLQFNSTIGYATGYLPILDAAPNVRPANASNKYLEIRNSSLKIYPRLIDGLKTALAEGDSFACIAYRKYFVRPQNRTANYVVRSKMGDYLFLDWHTALIDTVYLPDDLIGRSFEVHEKSSNVTLLSKFSTNAITVKIDSTKPYGYLVLKFSK